MSNQEQLVKKFKWYWSIRNGKFREQIRPIIKFLSKHLRRFFPRGEAPGLIKERL